MKYIINPAGNRIVVATPEETHELRPSIRACFIRWRANDGDLDDFCQDVEIVAWQAIVEKRIQGDRFQRPVDALLDFMFAVAWNVWRNHSRKRSTMRESIVDEVPDMSGPNPEGRIDARETLLRLTMHEDIARILLDSINVAPSIRYADTPKSTYGTRLANARQSARNIDAGRWRKPWQPMPFTWKQRKKKR